MGRYSEDYETIDFIGRVFKGDNRPVQHYSYAPRTSRGKVGGVFGGLT
ncbi:hypothetical protein LDG_7899 [Legionella drancourtii LLAP12]|uniref:Uncharacterized protein n=1 Tax=Legionella drancourtii LLAP12 TaxID=658187 RepID=G9ERI4_9GAMM|nr:hypothetical protein LDG_7899 [Legionella drancourtii LLAP12]